MRIRFTRKSKVVTAALVGVTFAASAGAYAYFSGGSGAGGVNSTANGPSLATLVIAGTTVDATTQQDANMVPGGPALNVRGTITNPNNVTVNIGPSTEPKWDGTVSVDKTGCPVSSFKVTSDQPAHYVDAALVPAGGHIEVYAAERVRFVDLPDVNQEACVGAKVTLHYTF